MTNEQQLHQSTDQRMVAKLTPACECENPSRESYTGRDGLRHCEQCDGLVGIDSLAVDAPKEQP